MPLTWTSKGNYQDMWVFCEQNNNQFVPCSIEMLGEARRLMDKYNKDYSADEKVVAVVFGYQIDALVQEAIERGADVVYSCDDRNLEHFLLEPYTKLIAKAAQGKDTYKSYDEPRYFLFPATNNGRDISATALAALDSGLASDSNLLYINDELIRHPVKTKRGDKVEEIVYPRILHMKRPDFSGFEWSTILCIDDEEKDFHPQACSVIPGSFKALERNSQRKGIRIPVSFGLVAKDLRTKIVKREALPKEADLTNKDVIVSLGRGIAKNPTQGIKLGLELAQVLNADVGISRGVVTAKYPVDPAYMQYIRDVRQVGETGQKVKPKVYIALGISGAIQHKKGMDKSKMIISVNADPNAPIKEFSDVFIEGDIFEVIPKLEAHLARALGGTK
ncbi:MAG: electron transfer flavoprotein subunit alpha/FixB family protein [Dehalococcoidia bacterium]|nr:electron transfer flavoprotein subunit alpha/FixB family protein [Dehalococcoidia bacterium]